MGPRDEIALPDGGALTVRPIAPSDAPELVAMHERLSENSIYRRYFAARPHLSPADVHRFTTVDQPWRFALVATRDSGELVAVARYEGSPGSSTAELALIVDDALQGCGVGRAMLERLVDVAALRGIDALVAMVLAANPAMLRLLRGTGLPLTSSMEYGTIVATVRLDELRLEGRRRASAVAHLDEATGEVRR